MKWNQEEQFQQTFIDTIHEMKNDKMFEEYDQAINVNTSWASLLTIDSIGSLAHISLPELILPLLPIVSNVKSTKQILEDIKRQVFNIHYTFDLG
jgi:hypothetical protein